MLDQDLGRPRKASSEQDSLPVSPPVGCLIAIMIGLLGVALVFALGTLLTDGEIRVGRQEATAIRLWLVSDEQAQGFGISSPRVVSRSAEMVCVQTDARFLLWRSDGSRDSLSYCECYRSEGGHLVFQEACPDDP